MATNEEGELRQGRGLGCALIALAINTAFIGGLTSLFAQGPYYSNGREFWYCYCTLGFFIVGVLLPTFAFLCAVHRKHKAVVYLTVWMPLCSIGFFVFAMLSGGGM